MACTMAGNSQDNPAMDFVLELNVTTGDAFSIGATGSGQRCVIPITGGSFSGPGISGDVLPGGADYQLADTAHKRTHLEAIYCLRTDDGEYIHVRNRGIIAGDYFYTSPVFEADADGRYSSLNDGIYVCRPSGGGDGFIKLRVWRLRDGTLPVEECAPVPDSTRQPARCRGSIETFSYRVQRGDSTFEKRAQVYLPHGYNAADTACRYNVVYLMHGGGDNTTSFFSDPRSPLPLTQVLDHLIADGTMDPVIVATPTFYDDDTNPQTGDMRHAAALTQAFHSELRDFLIPALESRYNTYYAGGVTESRDHRAFGGFSMGALTTWYQLAYDADAAAHYLPLSGDLWVYDSDGEKQTAEVAAAWLKAKLQKHGHDGTFTIHAASGTDDIAGTPELDIVNALASLQGDVFRTKGENANLHVLMKRGGKHYYGDINEYLYHILPRIWSKQQ